MMPVVEGINLGLGVIQLFFSLQSATCLAGPQERLCSEHDAWAWTAARFLPPPPAPSRLQRSQTRNCIAFLFDCSFACLLFFFPRKSSSCLRWGGGGRITVI